MIITPPPLSLYIHIPWCIKKCPYCDFNSHPMGKTLPEAEYIEALLSDFENYLPHIHDRKAHSIFIGGGTPSLFSGDMINKLLSNIDSKWPLPAELEITLEANPGAADTARFKQYRNAGVNRLSIGAQSFNSQHLEHIGRIHSSEGAIAAILAAKQADFHDFNIDLMFGLPHQTQDEALADLEQAIALAPSHLSWYQLTIEENTYFYRHPPILPQDDDLWDMYVAGLALLAQSGFQQYEVSAFYKIKKSIHNLNYWEFGDYLGIGAGAHSKVTDMITGQVHRAQRVRSPLVYLDPKRNFIAKQHVLSESDLIFEYMLNALRLTQGTTTHAFSVKTGLALETIAPILKEAQNKKWLVSDTTRIQATPLGQHFLNDLIILFLSAQ